MTSQDPIKPVKIKGKIIARPFGSFSKLEYEAFFFRTQKCVYILRLSGEEIYKSLKLKKLKNKVVTLTGIIKGNILFANQDIELT